MPSPFSASGRIVKIDPDKHQVFGWAQVAIEKGETEPFFDTQGDRIPDYSDLEKAGYDFVLHSRQSDSMHDEVAKGRLIESVVFTPEKLEKMGLPPDALPVGWWVGFHIDDPTTWADVKKGKLRAFSVGGRGVRTPVGKAKFSQNQRSKLADEGEAEENGSFPIRNRTDLRHAIDDWGRAGGEASDKAWITRRARELGAQDELPDDWT